MNTERRRRLTQTDVEGIRDAYTKWRQDGGRDQTVDELAATLGITKQQVYYWRDHNWTLDVRRRMRDGQHAGEASDRDLMEVVRYLTGELIAAKAQIAELERKLA